jgi:acetyl-CoA synthase
VLGRADDPAHVVAVVKDYQTKGILTFLIGGVIDQALEGGVKMGLDFRVVPLGHEVTAVMHAVTVAIRAALIFGAVRPGDLSAFSPILRSACPPLSIPSARSARSSFPPEPAPSRSDSR